MSFGILTKEEKYRRIRKGVETRMANGSYFAWNKGIPMREETKIKLSNSAKQKGFKPPYQKGKVYLSVRGEKHYNWNGGVHRTKHCGTEYCKWRQSVFERDNYTCQTCGQKGGYLNADHIKPFKLFPELRYDLNNGTTLCIPCHKKTDTFGGRMVTYIKKFRKLHPEHPYFQT